MSSAMLDTGNNLELFFQPVGLLKYTTTHIEIVIARREVFMLNKIFCNTYRKVLCGSSYGECSFNRNALIPRFPAHDFQFLCAINVLINTHFFQFNDAVDGVFLPLYASLPELQRLVLRVPLLRFTVLDKLRCKLDNFLASFYELQGPDLILSMPYGLSGLHHVRGRVPKRVYFSLFSMFQNCSIELKAVYSVTTIMESDVDDFVVQYMKRRAVKMPGNPFFLRWRLKYY